MDSVVRTIYGAHLATSLLLRRSYVIMSNSTLNQKFNVFPDEGPMTNEYPSIGYIGIGNKGTGYDVTPTNFVLTTPHAQSPNHASLYNHIPFIVRPLDDDLSSTERSKYRMRVITQINKVSYAVYYLKRLTMENIVPVLEVRNVVDRVITTRGFIPSQSDLSPLPPVISNVDINNPNGDYLVVSAKTPFVLNRNDIVEIMDACALLYGDQRYAVINEVAICSGVDRVVQGNFGVTTSSYMESIATQITGYVSVEHRLSEYMTEITLELDTGSVLPLLT